MLVHTQSSELLASYSIFELTIENAQVTTLETYPANWQGDPAPSSTANIGDKWLLDNATVALKVPSVIVPRESNFLLNPLHADFDTIVGRASNRSLKFDPRLKD
jgi:RES domain-containing protein